MSFTDKVAVVTGGSSGIGRAIGVSLAREGARVALIGRDAERLESIAGEIGNDAGRVIPYAADLACVDEIARVASAILADQERIDILVHSAGLLSRGGVEESTWEDFDWQYAVNLRAPYLLTQRVLRPLIESEGDIVFVNSTAVFRAAAGTGQYGATKHALKGLADSLRAEVNPCGVRVLTVYPGRTATPMQERVMRSEGREYVPERLMQPGDVASVVLHALQLPPTAEVTEITIRPMMPPTRA